MIKAELLSPAGNFEKLKTALYFGADAVYVGGKALSLRAQADNFDNESLKKAIAYTHERGKKIYVAVNVFAHNRDLDKAEEFLRFLESAGADAVIASDPGIIALCRAVAPRLAVHISTQANNTNKYSVRFWSEAGAERVVLARELSFAEIKDIHEHNPSVELECFIHGAMCISYSGRCLLSEYFNHRDANQGDCVQACRWQYAIREVGRDGDFYDISEDERGTYILNSKDLNMIDYIGDFVNSGVTSFKIEGRMKSEYYLATVVNAYRRAIDEYYAKGEEYKNNRLYNQELEKTAHRAFTTAYMLGENKSTVNHDNSQSKGTGTFIGMVRGYDKERGEAIVEMRNRFKVGDELEVLSPTDTFNKKLVVGEMSDLRGERVEDAKIVQQILKIKTELPLQEGDILRKV